MNHDMWKVFFETCATILGAGCHNRITSESWCAWTTFDRLTDDCQYWSGGIPALEDIDETTIKDSGVWGQPFHYEQLAHIIIPKSFYWEISEKNIENDGYKFEQGNKIQNIELLSKSLTEKNIPHRLTNLLLEVKFY